MVGLAYSAKGFGPSDLPGDFSVGTSLAIGDRQQGIPAFFLKLGADKVQLASEFPQLATKISLELSLVRAKLFLRFNPDFVLALSQRLAFVEQQETQPLAGSCKQQLACGRFHAAVIHR